MKVFLPVLFLAEFNKFAHDSHEYVQIAWDRMLEIDFDERLITHTLVVLGPFLALGF